MTPQPVPAVAARDSYRVPKPQGPIDVPLDTNEGAVPPLRLLEDVALHGPDLLRRYPDARPLEALLAHRLGVAPQQVLVTAGADDALDRACRAFLRPGRDAVLPVPTFEMLERFARLAGGRIVPVSWPGGPLPVDALREKISPDTGLIGVISPSNPTGAVATPDELRALSAAAPHALLLVDMAYGEFADEDLAPDVLALPNAIMIRTLSKAWGLAGARVGYAAGPPDVIGWLRAAGAPYPLAGTSLAIAEDFLRTGLEDTALFVARVREERAALHRLLTELGADPLPSQGNFVLARFADARWVWEALASLGIAVRAFPALGDADAAAAPASAPAPAAVAAPAAAPAPAAVAAPASAPGADIPVAHPFDLAACLRITCPGHEPWFERLTSGLEAAMRPQALLFDMDGVLADVSGSYRRAIVETAAAWGVRLDAAVVAAAKKEPDANNDWVVTQRLLARHGVEAALDAITERFEAVYQGTEERPGLRATEHLLADADLFRRLARRLPLAVVTGRPRADCQRFLEAQGVADCFRAVVCMEDGPLKPDPAPVRLALERLGARHAWMIGDTPDDLRAARAAGVIPIGIAPPGEDGAALIDAGASRVLRHLDDLEGMLP